MDRMKEEGLARKVMDASEQLDALANSPASSSAERRRALGLLNWARCRNQSAVARVTGRARSTQQRTLKAFDQFNIGGLRNRRTNARRQAAGLADTVGARLVELAAHTPQDYGWQRPTWTRELFCAELKEKFGIV